MTFYSALVQFNLQNPVRYYFSDVAVIFSHNMVSTRKVANCFSKRPVGSHRNTYLSPYTACSCFVFNTIGLHNRNDAKYGLSKQKIARSTCT